MVKKHHYAQNIVAMKLKVAGLELWFQSKYCFFASEMGSIWFSCLKSCYSFELEVYFKKGFYLFKEKVLDSVGQKAAKFTAAKLWGLSICPGLEHRAARVKCMGSRLAEFRQLVTLQLFSLQRSISLWKDLNLL